MSNLVYPLAKQTTALGLAQNNAEKVETNFLDLVRAEKIPATHFISPRSKDSTCPSQEWWDTMRAAVVEGLPKIEAKLYKTPLAGLDPAQVKIRKRAQTRIGERITDIKNGLLRDPDGKTPRVVKTGLDKASADFQAYLGKVQKYEDMPFDVVEMTALLNALGNKFDLK